MNAKKWMINFYPHDEAEWDKFRRTGLDLKVREDQEGGKYIILRRQTQKLIKDNLVLFSPPEITGAVNVLYQDDNGNTVKSYNKGDNVKVNIVGEQTPIGNDSVCLVNLSVYETPKGNGHRLENLKVLDLVEYHKPDQQVAEPVADKKPELKVVDGDLKKDLNDDIPW
jgi:hypothetical protein